MGLFDFLIVVQGIVAASLVGIILMQRSEGGGLGTGGSPSGLMSARGAADFMTRTTAVLAVMFVLLSVALAFVAAQRTGGTVDESFSRIEASSTVAPADDAAQKPADGADADATPPVEDAIPLDQ